MCHRCIQAQIEKWSRAMDLIGVWKRCSFSSEPTDGSMLSSDSEASKMSFGSEMSPDVPDGVRTRIFNTLRGQSIIHASVSFFCFCKSFRLQKSTATHQGSRLSRPHLLSKSVRQNYSANRVRVTSPHIVSRIAAIMAMASSRKSTSLASACTACTT